MPPFLRSIGVSHARCLIPIGDAADMTNIGTLFAFVLVCIGVVILRYTKPNQPRPFRLPFMPVVPILGMLACLRLNELSPMGDLDSIRRLWTAIGIVVYMGYGLQEAQQTGRRASSEGFTFQNARFLRIARIIHDSSSQEIAQSPSKTGTRTRDCSRSVHGIMRAKVG